jgi:hypothetical protein
MRLSNVGARVLAVDGLLKVFLGLCWHIVAGVEGGFPAVVVASVEVVEFGNVVEMGVVLGIEVVEFGSVAEMGWYIMLVVWLLKQGLFPLLLLAKDLDVVLKLYEPCSLHVNMLPFGFDTLSCCLPPCDGSCSWQSISISCWTMASSSFSMTSSSRSSSSQSSGISAGPLH